jgi:glycosyltransferase involved in cell wall biosynthesis
MKLSIITVNKNNAIGLEKTCQSVICQTFDDFEWIVIDGASSDDSVNVIKNYSNKMAYWTSEPDTGIYNAMNKGIRQAKGEYCLFLNSGDCLLNLLSLKRAFENIMNLDYADIYYGDCLFDNNSIYKMPELTSVDNFYLLSTPNHQNTFIKRSLFYDHEFYDENYRTVSDVIFLLKEFWLYHSKFIYINTVISIYSLGGFSTTYEFTLHDLHEGIKKIIGDSEYNILVKRYAIQEQKYKQIHIINYMKKIIKYLLPYGFVRFIQKYILK